MTQQNREEWVRLNTCRFCIGSHLHSCTGYDCRDALKQAEQYFERTEGKKVENERGKSEIEQLRDKFQSVVEVLDDMIALEAAGQEDTEEYEAKAGVLLIRLSKMQQ